MEVDGMFCTKLRATVFANIDLYELVYVGI